MHLEIEALAPNDKLLGITNIENFTKRIINGGSA